MERRGTDRFSLSPSPRLSFSLSLCLSLFLLVGCTDPPRRPGGSAAGTDPMFGAQASAPGGAGAAPSPTASIIAPPVPVPSTTQPLAALATGNTPAPLAGSHDQLGINDGWHGGKAVLQPPVPVVGTPVSNPSGGLRMTSFEQAQSLLDARGVKWQRLDMPDNGSWKFSCSVANPKNPNISHTYEAQAKAPLAAIQAVVEQIDKDKE